jgi:protease-4
MFWRKKIAVVSLKGSIGGGINPQATVRLLDGLSKNGKIRAVVLNIDSPGGGAGPSETLYMAVGRLSQKKPVVAYFEGMGASGAYEMAIPATRIVAPRSALIGSIGVISAKLSLRGLLERWGINLTFIKSGEHKDMLGLHRELTKEEEMMVQKTTDELYKDFISRVSESRHLPPEKVREMATGEVFSGRVAREYGLVDENGDLNLAIEIASKLSGVPTHRVVYVSPERSLLQMVMEPWF